MSRSQAETAIAGYIDGFYNPVVGTRRWTSQAPSNSRQKQCKRCRAPPLFLDGPSLARRQRPLEARRRPAAGPLAHVRRWRDTGTRAPDPPRDPRDDGQARARRLQLAPGRRGHMAHALGARDRRAPLAPRLALLARRRPAASHLGPVAVREHARAPAYHRRWRSSHRARARRRAGPRRARELRPRRRPRHYRRGSLRGRHGTRNGAPRSPTDGRSRAGASWGPTASRSKGRPTPTWACSSASAARWRSCRTAHAPSLPAAQVLDRVLERWPLAA